MTREKNPTGTEARVCADIAARQQLGVKKYGTTVADNPLSKLEWLRHAYEEALGLAVYLRRLIELEELPEVPQTVSGISQSAEIKQPKGSSFHAGADVTVRVSRDHWRLRAEPKDLQPRKIEYEE